MMHRVRNVNVCCACLLPQSPMAEPEIVLPDDEHDEDDDDKILYSSPFLVFLPYFVLL